MTEPHVPWLVQVAQAAVTEEDLVRGMIGEAQVEGVDEIREMLREMLATGWTRCSDLEVDSCYNAEIEYQVYSKVFDRGHRWLTLTCFVFFDAICKMQTFDQVP